MIVTLVVVVPRGPDAAADGDASRHLLFFLLERDVYGWSRRDGRLVIRLGAHFFLEVFACCNADATKVVSSSLLAPKVPVDFS